MFDLSHTDKWKRTHWVVKESYVRAEDSSSQHVWIEFDHPQAAAGRTRAPHPTL